MPYVIEYGNGSVYIGDVREALPHGVGEMFYENGDYYQGDFFYGKYDGYGVYMYAIGASYEGFFSYGKFHGVGTYRTEREISKGTWRSDTRHGVFHVKNLLSGDCTKCVFVEGLLVSKGKSANIENKFFRTYKKREKAPRKVKITGVPTVCRICFEERNLHCNTKCGHMACGECWDKVSVCAVCKAKKETITRLYWN